MKNVNTKRVTLIDSTKNYRALDKLFPVLHTTCGIPYVKMTKEEYELHVTKRQFMKMINYYLPLFSDTGEQDTMSKEMIMYYVHKRKARKHGYKQRAKQFKKYFDDHPEERLLAS